MRITHGHLDIAMPEDPLQRQDIPTTHHEVAGEGMREAMEGERNESELGRCALKNKP